MAAQEEQVDSAATLVAQALVLAVVRAGPRWLAVLAVWSQLAVAAELAAEEEPEALVELLSHQSFSAAMARTTP